MSTNRDDFGIAIRSALLQRGAAQKFSLFFLLSISIVIFFFDRYPNSVMNKTKSLLNDSIYTISSIASSPLKFTSHLSNNAKKLFFIYDENKLLKKELELLKNKELNLNFLKSENKILQETIDSTNVSESIFYDQDRILSKVMLDKKSPFLKSIILNRGSKSGIKKGMPVIDKNYLIGRIVETNYFTSRVLLLNDLNSRIPSVIEPNGIQGILTGDGNKEPRVDYLPELYVVEESSTVFTSGKDGVLPPGIPIGKTNFVNNVVKVKLFSETSQLSYVSVILTKGDE